MLVDVEQLQSALRELDVARIMAVAEMEGGSSPVFRLDLADGGRLVLKVYPDGRSWTPGKDAFAAAQLQDLAVPVTQYLLVDETKAKLPFRYAVTSYLPGVAAKIHKDHPDIASVYRQMGALLRKLHSVGMQGYGQMDASGIVSPVGTNAEFLRKIIAGAFEQFLHFGGDAALARRLCAIVDERFDDIVVHSSGPVFAHDDLHPGNVLVCEADDGTLSVSGLIDFGNARAADAVFDLAKCLFCSKHEAPGCEEHILKGYGDIDHPDPEGALSYYTLLHRVIMWWWLRHIGVIPSADTHSDLIDDLRAAARAWDGSRR